MLNHRPLVIASFDRDGLLLIVKINLGEFIFDHQADKLFEFSDINHGVLSAEGVDALIGGVHTR